MAAPWVSLFSGGKDSAWAYHRAEEGGRSIDALLTVHPPADSYLFHVPATRLVPLIARSIGRPVVEVEPEAIDGERLDAGERGDRELAPLEAALDAYRREHGGLAGITAGAVASEYQNSRLSAMCDRLGCALYAPLWEADPVTAGREMVDAGFDIRITRVAADGLDESWLGRRLGHGALDELVALNDRRGVHVLGEGGEYETLVVDGPHMARRLEFEATSAWAGTHGTLEIEDAWLAE